MTGAQRPAAPPPDRHVRLVLPPVWPGVFRHPAALFAAALADLGFRVEPAEVTASPAAALNLVLGWDLYEPKLPSGSRYAVVQAEPLRVEPWPERRAARAALFDGADAIWEYSEANLELHPPGRACWVPLRRHAALERRPPAEPAAWDVLFAGHLSPRRRSLLERLANRCAVTAMPRWDGELDAAMRRSKIVLNAHRSDLPTPLEQPRVVQALHQGAFVLSEASADAPYARLATAAFEDLEEAVVHHLRHAGEREEARRGALAAFRSAPSMTEVVGAALAAMGLLA